MYPADATETDRGQEAPQCILEQQNILVVEDNKAVAELTSEWIQQTGLYQVACAESFERAMKMFSPGQYFAVVLDLHLGTSVDQGIELAVRFRAMDDNVIIAAVTAWYPVFKGELLNAVDDCLPKPVDMHLLETKLIMWAIQYARRMALKSRIDRRVIELRQDLAVIRAEEIALRKEIQDLWRRVQIGMESRDG